LVESSDNKKLNSNCDVVFVVTGKNHLGAPFGPVGKIISFSLKSPNGLMQSLSGGVGLDAGLFVTTRLTETMVDLIKECTKQSTYIRSKLPPKDT
jgi:hypothetical protein